MAAARAMTILVAVATTGCTWILAYGELPEIECSDGLDDDDDGAIDCADDDCAAACVESSAVPQSCANMRDDDGDGRTDVEDAACWPLAAEPSVRRCASSAMVEFHLATPDLLYLVDAYVPPAMPTPIPMEMPEELVITNVFGAQPPRIRSEAPALAASTPTMGGRLNQMETEGVIDAETRAFIGFVPVELAPLEVPLLPDAISRSVGVVVDTLAGTITVVAPGYARTFPGFTGATKVTLSLAPDLEGGLVLGVTRDGGRIQPFTASGALPTNAIAPSRFAVEVDGRVVLDDLTLLFAEGSLCAAPVDGPADIAIDLGASTSVAYHERTSCALVVGCAEANLARRRAVGAWHRPDGFPWEEVEGGVVPLSEAARPVASAAVSWNEMLRRFDAAVLFADGAESAVAFYSSSDCTAWMPSGSEIAVPFPIERHGCDAATDVEGASIGLLARGDGELDLVLANRESGRVTIRTTAIGSDAWSAPISLEPELDIDLPISFVAIGTEDAALLHRLVSNPTSIGLSVWANGAIEGVSRPLLVPSGLERSFDRYSIRSATLVPGPTDLSIGMLRAPGTLYYAGRGDQHPDAPLLGEVGNAAFGIAAP